MTFFNGKCPVCHFIEATYNELAWAADGPSKPNDIDSAIMVTCPACGEYAITDDDDIYFTRDRLSMDWSRSQVSALLRERSLRKSLPKFWLRAGLRSYGPLARPDVASVEISDLLSQWPKTVADRLDRALGNLASSSATPGSTVVIPFRDSGFQSLLFASSEIEARFHLNSLTTAGYLVSRGQTSSHDYVVLTPPGWDRVEEFERKSASPLNKVFMAMWFGGVKGEKATDRSVEEMKIVYTDGIAPAVRRAGYDVSRVDLEQFNDSIMDKVYGDIRAAPFVVADFTGHRNGVYMESGFANGLGKPVIQTCEAAHFDDAHFDIRHINRIRWDSAARLQELLYERIRGTIGQGPYPYLPVSRQPSLIEP